MSNLTRIALVAALALTLAATANASAESSALVLEAAATRLRSSGPGADSVGHVQVASGVLHDVNGRAVGRFAYRCRWIAMLPHGDVREHCAGSGMTGDGRMDFAGFTHRATLSHLFAVLGGAGSFRTARGALSVHDVTEDVSVLTITLVVVPLRRSAPPPRIGLVVRPSANARFRTRAEELCRTAAARLASLAPFPFVNFDPAHPDRTLLPKVGHFFMGRRPIVDALDAKLRALGAPPADRAGWERVLAARDEARAASRMQIAAAVARDAAGFVRSLSAVDRAAREAAIATAAFGVPSCGV